MPVSDPHDVLVPLAHVADKLRRRHLAVECGTELLRGLVERTAETGSLKQENHQLGSKSS